MLERLARFCFRRWKLVGVAWLALLVVLGAASGAAGGAYHTEFRLPNTESKRGFDILAENFGGNTGGGFTGQLVFSAPGGVDQPPVRTAITEFITQVRAVKGLEVTSPFEPGGERQISSVGASAGKIAYADVSFPSTTGQAEFNTYRKHVDKVVPKVDGLTTELGGEAFATFEPPSSETLGLAFAIFILLIAFGSVLAMGLPVGVALAGIGSGIFAMGLLSHTMSMPEFTVQLGAMIGLGVGIDYALFIVTRYRDALHRGASPEDATAEALDTAGRAVLFAGITVVISLLGMLLMGLAFVRGLAVGASVTVVFTMLASLTLLPALLGWAKHRVEKTRRRGLIAVVFLALALLALAFKQTVIGLPLMVLALATIVAGFFVPWLKVDVPRRAVKPIRATFWYRWSRVIQHRPWRAFAAGLAALLLLAAPVFSLRLAFTDTGNYPEDTTTRKAYNLMVEGFGAGFNGPLLVTTLLPAGTSQAAIDSLSDAFAKTDGVAFAGPAVPNKPDAPTALLWQVVPKTSPQDEATSELVHRLRAEVIPQAVAGTGLQPAVSGATAANIDFADYIGRRLPYFFGAVLILSFLLLMAVFRSLLVPLKAVVMNLLSIGAAYGTVVAIFQWGWLGSVFGVGRGGPIEPWVPMMMFAIVFGLSMDYEVFLLSRMREEFLRTRDNATAVADGLAVTARVITAAAAIMVFVFGSFLLEANRQIKLFGVGLAVAVLLDATLVRMVLVPATMELLGARNWWLPRWLDKLLPKISVEGHEHPSELISTGGGGP
jgi:putative drug exporter of the RND superfamily